MIFDKDFKTLQEIDDLKKRVFALSRNISELAKQQPQDNSEQITEISNTLEQVKDDLQEGEFNLQQLAVQVNLIASQIEDLEGGGAPLDLAPVATTGSYSDLLKRPDEFFEMGASFRSHYKQTWNITLNSYEGKRIWFTNAIDTEIEGRVTFEIGATRRVNSINEEIRFMLNQTVLVSLPITNVTTLPRQEELSFKFRPKKSLNNFSFILTKDPGWLGSYYLTNFNIEINYGKNVFFLNRDWNWQVQVYKDKYIVYCNEYPHSCYYIKNKDDFDFSTGKTLVDYRAGKDLICFFNATYPTDSDYLVIQEDDIWSVGLDSNGYYPSVTIIDSGYQHMGGTEAPCHSYSITYFREYGNTNRCPSICFIMGEEGRLTYWEYHVPSFHGMRDFTLNGQPLEAGVWIEVSAVNKQDMSSTNYRGFKGCVAMKYSGECVFLPHYNSTYTINLGFGRRVNAFYQDDGSINVYMGRYNYVIKKVLVLNSETNEYEIDEGQELQINGYDEIVETLDGCFIGITDEGVELVPWQEINA